MVGSALLSGSRAEGLSGCDDVAFCERVDRLIDCFALSKEIKKIVTRWKIPIRFDPQSLIVWKAVEWGFDVKSERGFARCLRDVAGISIGVTAGNSKGHLLLQVFTRWHSVHDIATSGQRLEELRWIRGEACKAKLPQDLLQEVQAEIDEEEKLQKAGGCFNFAVHTCGQAIGVPFPPVCVW